MQIKRALLLIAGLLVSISLLKVSVHADDKPTISVSNITAEPGQEVTLSVDMTGNPGICTLRLGINYDQGLTLTGVKDKGLFKDSMFGGDMSANPYYVMWDESVKGGNNKSNGTLVTLTFKVSEEASPGTYKVWISYRKGDIYNYSLTDVDFELVTGSITIPEKATPAVSEDNTDNNTTQPIDKNETVVTNPDETDNNNNIGSNTNENNNDATNNGNTGTDNTDTVTPDTGNNENDTKPDTNTDDQKENSGDKVSVKSFTITTTGETGKKIVVKYTIESSSDSSSTSKTNGRIKLTSLKTDEPNVTIPDTVTYEGKTYTIDTITKNALKGNKKVKTLVIGKNVTSIGQNAFKSMKKLKTITINSGNIKEIGTGAFNGIYKKATIKVKASKSKYKAVVELIKASGIGEKVKFKRVK